MPFIPEKTYIGRAAKSISSAPEFMGYSKVVINIDDETKIEVGNDLGRTLELSCPWGTQEMAEKILVGVTGFQYQPYTAESAILDPAAEIGDGITAGGIYSGIYQYNANLGSLYTADVSAPGEEEVDHEYPYESYGDRTIVRKFLETRAEFKVQGEEISAKVSEIGGNNKTFGWQLTSDGFVLTSSSKNVFQCDNTGITVTGKIQATSGYIGSTSGFTINSTAIYNGVTSYSDTKHTGVYVGTDGIVLGKGAFKVDSAGNLYANSGTFNGTVRAGSIAYGGNNGTFNGAGITGSSISTAKTSAGINASLGYADFSNQVYNGLDEAPYMKSKYLFLNGTQCVLRNMSFVDGLNQTRTFTVVQPVGG